VLNKRDLLPPKEAEQRARAIVRALRYRGPHFLISGATGAGTRELCEAVMRLLEADARAARERASSPAGTAAGPQAAT
jgi:GTPase